MIIPIKRLTEHAKLPTHGTAESAGYDLYADLSNNLYATQMLNINDNYINIRPHETELVPTGIAIAIPSGYFGGIYARSGLATRQGLRPANCVSVIDADYRGELLVPIHNDSDTTKKIVHGERIAQLVIHKFQKIQWEETDQLTESERGAGGFGSTGR